MKRYALECSPLFRLRNKRVLAHLAHSSLQELVRLAGDRNYRVFSIRSNRGKKQRLVQEPLPRLKAVHSQVRILLSRITVPDYLFSGRKGRSYVDNARYHLLGRFALTLDVEDFYPSCTREHVFRLFFRRFRMAEDVAWLLADVLTFKGILPTGSPASQLLAFWAFAPTFDQIHNLASANGSRSSVYVDDLTFSSPSPISTQLLPTIDKILSDVGLKIKTNKTRQYGPHQNKLVTGAVVAADGTLRVPNRLRKSIVDDAKKGALSRDGQVDIRQVRSTLGKLAAARQIEPNIFPALHRKYSLLAKGQRA